jgi:hypothetical protein
MPDSPGQRYFVFRDLSNGHSDPLPKLCSLVHHPSDWVGWVAVANILDRAPHIPRKILRDLSQLALCRIDVYMLESSARTMGPTGAVECVPDLFEWFTFTQIKPEGVIFAPWREAIICAIGETGGRYLRDRECYSSITACELSS